MMTEENETQLADQATGSTTDASATGSDNRPRRRIGRWVAILIIVLGALGGDLVLHSGGLANR